MSEQREQRTQDRTLALAGIFQACKLVIDLANEGKCDEGAYLASLESLFALNPASTLDVYGGHLVNVQVGLEQLAEISGKNNPNNFNDLAKYVLSIIALYRQARKNKEMMQVVRSRLEHMHYKKVHFTDDTGDITKSLSGLYQDTLSKMKFRIQVTGNMQHLTNPAVSDKIRTLLFAAFRSAMLWHQLGGSKWQLVLGRGEIQVVSTELLNETSPYRHHDDPQD
ncbi:High frequency lysogenization protein HflD [BD1-7 clade bacterium]|uniref:High frequency lysogenization protein HflD homolog n=1 Tax=BD1-7 clade bacterium TaxID=2029982 RepID=A0A5S9QY36_9GAMM|nr:High frequency lysogenization protein HflD [BD1-7 clade bacterium]